jgi:hypothetical protein
MSDDTSKGPNFLQLETWEQQRVARQARLSVPPPAEPPKIPRCGYCGTDLAAPEKQCVFCPARDVDVEEEQAPQTDMATADAEWRAMYKKRAAREGQSPTELLEDADPARVARFFGLRNKVRT